jgi:hypothetical protein
MIIVRAVIIHHIIPIARPVEKDTVGLIDLDDIVVNLISIG